MALSSVIQVIAAALGVIGSLFFTIGIVRQSTAAMAKLSQTYFDANLAMIRALAAQRADYIFGGAFIVFAFAAQMGSFLPSPITTVAISARGVVLIAILASVIVFVIVDRVSKHLAGLFERQIQGAIKAEADAAAAAERARRGAK